VSANSVVFSEYAMHALSINTTPFMGRFIAFICITFCLVMHGVFLKWGLRLQNVLGLFKLVILFSIPLTGILHVIGAPGFELRDGVDEPRNFEWETFWEGSGTGPNALITGITNVIWSFIGYSNANYALSEVRDPVRTIKRAAPAAMISVSSVYLFVNLAYFAVVSKKDILGSGRIVVAIFFRNIFGPTTGKVVSLVISLSSLGNILAVLFTQGRIIQELGREGILPYSSLFASNKPFNAPLAGLAAQWLVSSLIMISAPPGDAFLFIMGLSSYCLALINAAVALGLLILHTPSHRVWNWSPPFKAPRWAVTFYLIVNAFLIAVPFVPPSAGTKLYDHLPYWSHAIVAWLMSFLGVAYWYYQFMWIPRKYGYRLEKKWIIEKDGSSRSIFHKVPI